MGSCGAKPVGRKVSTCVRNSSDDGHERAVAPLPRSAKRRHLDGKHGTWPACCGAVTPLSYLRRPALRLASRRELCPNRAWWFRRLWHGHRHHVAVEVGDDPDRAGNDEENDEHAEG